MGLVLFEMREREVVHCMVSECALRNCAQLDGEADNEVENLFFFYQRKVETIASRQCGFWTCRSSLRCLVSPHFLDSAKERKF